MMTDKELIRRAMLGSREAQQECTEKGIVLPCPCCKGEAYTETFFERKGWRTVVGCSECPVSLSTITYDTEEIAQKKALKDWNTRPAPPIGRCKDCLWYLPISKRCKYSLGGLWGEVNELSFCSCFNPKEE